MIITLVHFSDIHFKENRNVIESRKEKLFNAIKNELKAKDAAFIITSGDIAFSGKDSEYKLAKEFYKFLYQSIRDYTNLESKLLFIPGNHDCKFDDNEEEIRKLILKSLAADGVTEITDTIINQCCTPQLSFNKFCSDINSKLHNNGDLVFDHNLLKIYTFKFSNYVLKFNLYNSSWDSLKSEKIGSLKFPIGYLYEKIPAIENHLSISLVHHPFNWQSLETSKDFRTSLVKTSDLIISGHEHTEGVSAFADILKDYNSIHIESPALQETGNDRNSKFNLINVDLTNLTIELLRFGYDTASSNYKLLHKEPPISIQKGHKYKSRQFELKTNWVKELENPGATFTHKQVDEVKLSDIFVSPYFNHISIEDSRKKKLLNFIHSESALQLPSEIDEPYYKLILGTESSGKSVLLRHYYRKFYDISYYPVYISAEKINDITEDRLRLIIEKEFSNQYAELEGTFKTIDFSKIILLIDDLHKFKNPKGKIVLIHNLKKLFSHLLITAHEIQLYESFVDKANESIDVFEGFDKLIIQEFSPSLRTELITKWHRLGKDYLDIEEREKFYKGIDIDSSNITDIIGKNFIPAYPIYILSILQAAESTDTGESSNNKLHAYYYEHLITKSLKNALTDKDEIGFYMTLSKEYFYFLFENKIRFTPIDKSSFDKFLDNHKIKYQISKLNHDKTLSTLIEARILKLDSDSNLHITHKYLYYYFVAKYLSDYLDEEPIKETVDLMTDRIYRDEYSNIVLFLTHLSRSKYVVSKLIEKSRLIFPDFEPSKIEEDVHFINELQKEIPEQIIQNLDIEKSRESELLAEDDYEAMERELENQSYLHDYDLREDINTIDFISKMTKALRTITLLGQLTKKYWGELVGDNKFNLAEETILLALRTLKYQYYIIEGAKEPLIQHLRKMISKKFINEQISKAEVEGITANFIFAISTSAAFSVFKRTITSIGLEKLSDTFEAIEEKHVYNSIKLIMTGIKLDHYNAFPLKEIESLKKDNTKNPLGFAILQNLVMDYLYMYPVKIERKQQICNMLNIKLSEQRLIYETSQIKKK